MVIIEEEPCLIVLILQSSKVTVQQPFSFFDMKGNYRFCAKCLLMLKTPNFSRSSVTMPMLISQPTPGKDSLVVYVAMMSVCK